MPEIALARLARDSGLSQQYYQGTVINVQRIQDALRAGERGNTWLYFTIVRDMVASFTHLQAEWAKRKNVIVGQPISLLPADAENADDVTAVNVIREALDGCDNWQEGVKHLLDATLYPMALAEKIWEPLGMADKQRFRFLRTYRLKQIAPVNPLLFCFEVPYRGGMPMGGDNPATTFNADDWENWLRIYRTMPDGAVNYAVKDVYEVDPAIHIIHRGGQISPTIPPNFGGAIRAILFWWLFATQDRDWWTLMMAKYGLPIPVGKVDGSNTQAVSTMRQALALGTQLGGIAIDRKASLEWSPSVGTDGSNAHKIFQDFAHSEVSKLVVGQVTSARPEKGGLAGGMAEQAEQVREDIRQSDMTNFAWTLEHQLFPQILEVNGYRPGRVRVSWGGLRPEQTAMLGKTAASFYQAGVRLADEGVDTLSEKTGMLWERVPDDLMQTGGDAATGNDDEKPNQKN